MIEEKKRLYLAGPMHGYKDYNFPAFYEAAESFKLSGYQVYNPAKAFDPASDTLTPDKLRLMWSLHLTELCRSDEVWVLPGWQSSEGATIEVQLANLFGIPVLTYPEGTRLVFQGNRQYLSILRELSWIHQLKGADYGTEQDSFANVRSAQEFGVPDWIGTSIRANDKMQRIKSFCLRRSLMNESLEDAYKDLASYAIISLILYREENDGE